MSAPKTSTMSADTNGAATLRTYGTITRTSASRELRRGALARLCHLGRGIEHAGRKDEGEAGPAAGRAGHREVAAHAARQVTTDGQPETDALGRVLQRAIELYEWFEDRRLSIRRNSRPGVAHGNGHDVARRGASAHGDGCAGGGVSNRVRQKIEQDLTNPLTVAENGQSWPTRRVIEGLSLGRGLRQHQRLETREQGVHADARE